MAVPITVVPRVVRTTVQVGEPLALEYAEAGATIWYDSGDGSPTVMHSNGFQHAYARPGRYTLTLSVWGPNDTAERTYTHEILVYGELDARVGEERLLLPRELMDPVAGRYSDNPLGVLPGPYPSSIRTLHANMGGVWELVGTPENLTAYAAVPGGSRVVPFGPNPVFTPDGQGGYLDAGPVHRSADGSVLVMLALAYDGSLHMLRSLDDGASWDYCGEVYKHSVPAAKLLADDAKPIQEQEYRRAYNNGTAWVQAPDGYTYVYVCLVFGPIHGERGVARNLNPCGVLRCSTTMLETSAHAQAVPPWNRLDGSGLWTECTSPGWDQPGGWRCLTRAGHDGSVCYCRAFDTYLMFVGGGSGERLYVLTSRSPSNGWGEPRLLWTAPPEKVIGCFSPLVSGQSVSTVFELAFMVQPMDVNEGWIEWWGLSLTLG